MENNKMSNEELKALNTASIKSFSKTPKKIMNNKETEEALSPDQWYYKNYPQAEYPQLYNHQDAPLWPEWYVREYAKFYASERLKIDAPSEDDVERYIIDSALEPELYEGIRYGVNYTIELLTKGKDGTI